MTQLLWCTDIHLDHLPPHGGGAKAFGRYMAQENPEVRGMVLTGDISVAPSLLLHLQDLAEGFAKPIYFVLGNHDYYRGSFHQMDEELCALDHPQLIWLRQASLLEAEWALVGNGGWYDGRYGDAAGTPVEMSDWNLIAELAAGRNREQIMALQRQRADGLAAELRTQIESAVEAQASRVFVATHVPPYQEACWHEGKTSDDRWAPWFTSGATGTVLDAVADAHPDREFIVLCGHTHSPGEYERRRNLRVYTGRAQYGAPDRAGVLHVASGDVRTLR